MPGSVPSPGSFRAAECLARPLPPQRARPATAGPCEIAQILVRAVRLRDAVAGPKRETGSADANLADDAALVSAVLKGEARARLEFAARLRVVARVLDARNRRLGAPLRDHELEDVLQDTVTKIWEHLPRFRGHAALDTWMYPIAVRTLSNALRERRNRGAWLPRDRDVDPDQLLAAEEDLAAESESLTQALDELTPERARVVRMRHLDEASFDEIGVRLGVPPGTAKTWYYRAISALRERLARRSDRRGEAL